MPALCLFAQALGCAGDSLRCLFRVLGTPGCSMHAQSDMQRKACTGALIHFLAITSHSASTSKPLAAQWEEATHREKYVLGLLLCCFGGIAVRRVTQHL